MALSMNMNTVDPFALPDEQKDEILRRVAALDESRRSTPTNARVWSPLQIVQHLILFEKEYLHFIEEGEKKGVSSKRPSRHPMIAIIIWVMSKRISVPTMPTMEPGPETRPLSALIAEWDAVRDSLHERLEKGGLATNDAPVALNPLLGPLNAAQMLKLIASHQDYHLSQIPAA